MRNETLLPRACTLGGFARQAGGSDGIALDTLTPGTTLLVETRNSQYRVTVLDGEHRDVLVQGGAFFPEAVEARLQGATAGGCLVKTGWIQVGLRVELRVGSQQIVTSPVRTFAFDDPPPSGTEVDSHP